MKDLQKGFIVPVLIAVIALLLIGGGVYVYETKKAVTPVPADLQVQQSKVLTSNSRFISSAQPEINVLSPNGGERFLVGKTIPITWSTQNAGTSKISIFLNPLCDDADTSEDIPPSCESSRPLTGPPVENNGHFTTTINATGRYIIRTCLDNFSNICDDSGVFTVGQYTEIKIPIFSIVYPNGGENIKIGDRVGITWKNSSISTKKNVTIYLIQNLSGCFNLKSGQSCLAVVDPETIIASNIANTGFYSWTTTNKGSYYLKICMGLEKTVSSCDTSDELFTVVDPIEMADKAPIISNIKGDTNLKVNENGTWTVFATDPEGKKISYSMSVTKTHPVQTNPSKIVGIKPAELYSPVINWKFDQVGTYLLEFTASDFYGKTATSNMTVTVQ